MATRGFSFKGLVDYVLSLKAELLGVIKGLTSTDVGATPNPNLLINGDFSVWQRGDTFTGLVGKYCPDRVAVFSSGSDSCKKVFAPESAESTFACEVVGVSPQLRYSVELPSEGKTDLNTSLTFSAWVYSSGSRLTRMTAYQDEVIVTSNRVVVENSFDFIVEPNTWKKIEFTIDASEVVPASTNKALFIAVYNRTSSGVQTLRMTDVKLEKGERATPFVPDSSAVNLSKCQRYFYQSGSCHYATYNYQASSSAAVGQSVERWYTFPTTMRTGPSMNTVSASSGMNVQFIPNLSGAGAAIRITEITSTGSADKYIDFSADAEI